MVNGVRGRGPASPLLGSDYADTVSSASPPFAQARASDVTGDAMRVGVPGSPPCIPLASFAASAGRAKRPVHVTDACQKGA